MQGKTQAERGQPCFTGQHHWGDTKPAEPGWRNPDGGTGTAFPHPP